MSLGQKNTIENLTIILAGVLLFNGLVNITIVGEFFRKYPVVMIVAAIVLFIAKEKIAEILKFLNRELVENVIILLSGVLLFNGMIHISAIAGYFASYPFIIILLSLVLLMSKDKIANTLGK